MKFLLSICAPPSTNTAVQALSFAQTLIDLNHEVVQLFFFAEGVLNARYACNELGSQWSQLIQTHNIDAVCCANSAAAYHLLDVTDRFPGFELAGIAQLTTQASITERCITFGTRTLVSRDE
ncbi:sulfur relay (sulfurtransferase) complex TusBCD TusD component (DsrE family) [Alteromonadaceae bacterium 2753L.S.0a.02]|nr:sulfur relay (sulfurtransferase) complex TusBCD TusD component (DsrE family) [Alteromonadaceae bacterium 2753L.S.0a.02]